MIGFRPIGRLPNSMPRCHNSSRNVPGPHCIAKTPDQGRFRKHGAPPPFTLGSNHAHPDCSGSRSGYFNRVHPASSFVLNGIPTQLAVPCIDWSEGFATLARRPAPSYQALYPTRLR